jgi:hypothetical protein
VSKTRSYRILYTVLGPALPLLRRLAPNRITSTEQLAQAMLAVATSDPADPADATPHILDPAAINRLAVQPA